MMKSDGFIAIRGDQVAALMAENRELRESIRQCVDLFAEDYDAEALNLMIFDKLGDALLIDSPTTSEDNGNG